MMMEQVSRSLYRAVLRFARYSNGVPFSLRASEVRAAVPILEWRGKEDAIDDDGNANENLDLLRRRLDAALEGHHGSSLSSSAWDSSSLVRQVARIAAEAGREASRPSPSNEEEKEERGQALDAAFGALRALNEEHSRSVAAARASRAAHSRRRDDGGSPRLPPPPRYKVGQVFVHKKFGYRAVIVGWDRSCARGRAWAEAVHVSTPDQPFYSCLPSEDDCVSIFGAARSSKYVAEENVDAESLPPGGSRVTHPLLRSFFDGWSEEDGGGGGGGGEGSERGGGRYLGNARLRYEYPDDFDGLDDDGVESSGAAAAAVEDDSNLLLSDGERELRRRRQQQQRRRGDRREENQEAAPSASAPASASSSASAAAVEPAASAEGVER